MPRKRCKQSYTKKNGHVFDKSILCAESGDDLKSACYGDSGGPLYDETNQKLVGIVSNGPRDCSGRPVRFARVGAAVSDECFSYLRFNNQVCTSRQTQ